LFLPADPKRVFHCDLNGISSHILAPNGDSIPVAKLKKTSLAIGVRGRQRSWFQYPLTRSKYVFDWSAVSKRILPLPIYYIVPFFLVGACKRLIRVDSSMSPARY